MAQVCPICEDSGLRVVRRPDGVQVAEDCVCRIERRVKRLLDSARIPRRFQGCSFESYETMHPSSNETLKLALGVAKHFAEGFPITTAGTGLLFTGSKGLGKTHLSISLLKSLITNRGATGIFWEHKELMENLRAAMFSNASASAEEKLLRSVTKCDVLVLDDLGDITPSDWSWDTTSYILNSRYNDNLSTIITTNLENREGLLKASDPDDRFAQARQAATKTTLGDRIGARMWSRLQEMCVVVEMQGEDFRQKVKRASFA